MNNNLTEKNCFNLINNLFQLFFLFIMENKTLTKLHLIPLEINGHSQTEVAFLSLIATCK